MLLLCFDEGADESGGRPLRHDGATHEVEGNKSSIIDLSRVLYGFRPLTRHHSPSAIICTKDMRENGRISNPE